MPDPVNQLGLKLSRLLTVDEVARQLRCSQSMVYALVRRGELTAVRIGVSVRFREQDVEAFVNTNLTGQS